MVVWLEMLKLKTKGIVRKHWTQVGKFVSHGGNGLIIQKALCVLGS